MGGRKRKVGRKEIRTETKSLRSGRRDKHRSGGLAFHRNRETVFATDGTGDRLGVQRLQLVDLLWEDERVQLESLALNPLVYLLDNPHGKPVYKSQQVFREDQRFNLALREGVCIAELISEPRLTLGKRGGKECFIFRNPPSPTSFTISPTSSFLIRVLY